jgi:hypothetical protein
MAPTLRVRVGWCEVRLSRAGGSWKLGRRTLPWSLVCDIDFGHEFWTSLAALAAGEWQLSQKRSWSQWVVASPPH